MSKYNFYMAKYYFHIIDNELGYEYDKESYFLDHDEADKYMREEESAGNVVIITRAYEWVHVDELPYNIECEFSDVKYEEKRFWERYLNGELGLVPIGIVK